MKKKIVALILVISVLTGVCACEPADCATRGEWLVLLADTFGFDSYQSETPYYSDVTNENELFCFVQSAYEWDALSIYDEDTFQPDTAVTREEIASTLAAALELDDAESVMDEKIVKGRKKGKVTSEECTEILERACEFLANEPGEETISVTFNEGVKDLSDASYADVQVNGNQVTISSALTNQTNLETGDTIISPKTAEDPFGVAYKITGKQANADGTITLTTTTPNLSDIYEDLEVHTTTGLAEDMITWNDDVDATLISSQTKTSGSEASIAEFSPVLVAYGAESRSSGGHRVGQNKDLSHTWRVSLKNGKPNPLGNINTSISGADEDLEMLEGSNFAYTRTPKVSDFSGKGATWKRDLSTKENYSNGYEITGEITLELSVFTNVNYHKLNVLNHEIQTWPETASLTLDSHMDASLALEGELEGRREVGHFIIPIADTGLTVKGKLFVYADLDGSVKVEAEFTNVNRATWGKNKRLNTVNSRRVPAKNEAKCTLMTAADVSVGTGVSADLCAFATKIIGAEAKAYGDIEAEGKLIGKYKDKKDGDTTKRHYQESIRLASTLYVPLVSLSVSGPDELAEKYDLEKTWEIINKKKAKKYKIYQNEWVIWEKDVELDEGGNPIIDFDFSPYAGKWLACDLNHSDSKFFTFELDEYGVIKNNTRTSDYSGMEVPLDGENLQPIEVSVDEEGVARCTLFNEVVEDGLSQYIGYTLYPKEYAYSTETSDWFEFYIPEDTYKMEFIATWGIEDPEFPHTSDYESIIAYKYSL